jgi:hypothetical protein
MANSDTSPSEKFSGRVLVEWGWRSGPHFKPAIAEGQRLLEAGRSMEEIRNALEVFRLPPKLQMRDTPLPLGEAIEAETDLDRENIEKVRKYMRHLLQVPVVKAGAVMPDACPAGSQAATITVGGAIAVENALIPAAHSADVCCSMFCTIFEASESPSEILDAIQDATRFGAGGRSEDSLVDHPVIHEDIWDNPFLSGLERYARIHMADQGDGNHFAYLGRVSFSQQQITNICRSGVFGNIRSLDIRPGRIYYAIVTHHGSRGLGAQLYKRGKKCAAMHTKRIAEGIPEAAHWIPYDTEDGKAYWEALQYVGRWTRANHECVHRRTMIQLDPFDTRIVAEFGNEHNFVWERGTHKTPVFYHGKGATPAWRDEYGRRLLGLIPLNMASPILIVTGADNSDYLSFCPHGAGRNLSRTQVLAPFRNEDGKIDEEKMTASLAKTTEGLDIRWFSGKPDLSESPIGYKDADQVRRQIEKFGLAQVQGVIQPIGCIMAGEGDEPSWKSRKRIQKLYVQDF